ncbi:hypothetical protein R2R70_13575 [Cobetia sp. SIMBA_158]|uniref:hypothetical protein n=1 Tax=Cobetia sp. SIMBA_158 TaxID=3081617 RepID=UPI00397EA3ED
MVLFLAESPLQVISCYELFKQKFSGERVLLVVKYSGERKKKTHDYQLKKTIEALDWPECTEVSFLCRVKQFSWAKKRFVKYKIIKACEGRASVVCMGDFKSEWMHDLKMKLLPESVYLTDDGVGVIEAKEKYIDKGLFHRNKKSGWLSGDDYVQPIIFSSFVSSSGDGSSVHNDYRSLRAESRSKETDVEAVFYFGAKYSEAGIMSLEDELVLISMAKLYFEERGKKIKYIPHRADTPGKLELIESQLNIPVNPLGLPAELYLLKLDYLPWGIAGAFTSALLSLDKLFDFESVVSFEVPSAVLRAESSRAISNIYKEYRQAGIDVVGLDFNKHDRI